MTPEDFLTVEKNLHVKCQNKNPENLSIKLQPLLDQKHE